MSRQDPLLWARAVRFRYGRDLILDDATLEVCAGDFLAIIGPNGGGKTTLLKLLLGLLRPDRGNVGSRLSRRGGARGYVPQFAGFDKEFPLRVNDVVRMGRLGLRGSPGRYSSEDRTAVDAVLDRFGLQEVSATPIGELSGGQMQRALIARAVVSEPEILLLDEPLASIDAEFRTVLLDTLKELHRKIPIVIVTHDLTPFGGLAQQIACINRTVHFHEGGHVDSGMLEEVYGCPVELVTHGVPHRVLEEHDS